jgi:hypothetical protein
MKNKDVLNVMMDLPLLKAQKNVLNVKQVKFVLLLLLYRDKVEDYRMQTQYAQQGFIAH